MHHTTRGGGGNPHAAIYSDRELRQYIADMDTLISSGDGRWLARLEAYARDVRREWLEGRAARTVHRQHYRDTLAAEVVRLTGAEYERCQELAEGYIDADARWLVLRELHRLADLVRSGAKYPADPTPIADEADQRHAEMDAAILAQWGQEFELSQMSPDEQRGAG